MSISPFLPAHRLAALVRAGKIGCLELLDLYLERVEQHNAKLNAIVVLDTERARKRARAADRALAKGEVWGPLHGVPVTIKESFDVEGLPTTWGHPELKDNIAQRNALAVDRLLAAGAVLFGKTNIPTALADWQTFNPIHGTTNNPWDLSRVPGGSSGGAAAALAAGLTGLETGSDIGASIRNPAHYCGVYGHKPTFGICSSQGQTAPPRITDNDIAVIGPLARSARDLEIALKTIAGPGRDRRSRLAAAAAAAAGQDLASVARGRLARRTDRGGRPQRAGSHPRAGRFPGQERREGELRGAARHRPRAGALPSSSSCCGPPLLARRATRRSPATSKRPLARAER